MPISKKAAADLLPTASNLVCFVSPEEGVRVVEALTTRVYFPLLGFLVFVKQSKEITEEGDS